MSLNVDRVPFKLFRASAKKVVEADFKQRGSGGIGGNMPADAVVHTVCTNHHRQGVPANQALDPAFDFLIAGKYGLLVRGNRIDVGSVRREYVSNPKGFRASTKPVEQQGRRIPAFRLQYRI